MNKKHIAYFYIYVGFLIFIFAVYAACNKFSCTPPFNEVNNISFDRKLWSSNGYIDANRMPISEDSLLVYLSVLEKRKLMLCDIVTNVIKKKDSFDKVVKVLGPGCETCRFHNHRTISFENMVVGISPGKKKLMYPSGYNASGECYFVITFEEDKVEDFFYSEAI
jgi:hypothetical protein